MEDYWFDLELYFPLKVLVDLKTNNNLTYRYSDFDVEWTRLWSFWELYFNKYYGQGVEIFVRNPELSNKNSSWLNAVDYFKFLAKTHKLELNPKFPNAGFIETNRKIISLNEKKRPYELLELKINLSKQGKNYLTNNLKEYFKKYLNNDLKNTEGTEFISVDKQFEKLTGYLQKKIRNDENPKDIWVYDEELLSGKPLKEENMGKYSPVDRKFRVLEPLGTLLLADFININEIHFYDENIPGQFKEGCYWFFGHISINEDINNWSIESVKEALGVPINNTKIRKPDKRDYWYENSQLRFNLAGGGIDQFDFSKAEISRKLFETFYELWEGDSEGSYTIKQITAKYNSKFKLDPLEPKRIGEVVSNIRASIINPKTIIQNRLIWKFDRPNKKWIFKIDPLKH